MDLVPILSPSNNSNVISPSYSLRLKPQMELSEEELWLQETLGHGGMPSKLPTEMSNINTSTHIDLTHAHDSGGGVEGTSVASEEINITPSRIDGVSRTSSIPYSVEVGGSFLAEKLQRNASLSRQQMMMGNYQKDSRRSSGITVRNSLVSTPPLQTLQPSIEGRARVTIKGTVSLNPLIGEDSCPFALTVDCRHTSKEELLKEIGGSRMSRSASDANDYTDGFDLPNTPNTAPYSEFADDLEAEMSTVRSERMTSIIDSTIAISREKKAVLISFSGNIFVKNLTTSPLSVIQGERQISKPYDSGKA